MARPAGGGRGGSGSLLRIRGPATGSFPATGHEPGGWLIGANLVMFPRARVWSLVPVLLFIPLRLPAWLVLGLWFVLQWVYSAGYAVSDAGGVAYLAHVLGFVVGMLVALPLAGRTPRPARRRRRGYRP